MDHRQMSRKGQTGSLCSEAGGSLEQIPKERFTTALKISGMIRLGVQVCAECGQVWDEEVHSPLQDECGHVKCRSCFNHGSDHSNPCSQCMGSSARKESHRKRKTDYAYEDDKEGAPVILPPIGHNPDTHNRSDVLEIVDVRDIVSGRIGRDRDDFPVDSVQKKFRKETIRSSTRGAKRNNDLEALEDLGKKISQRFPEKAPERVPVSRNDPALKFTENDKKTASLYKGKKLPPPPPLPVRDIQEKPFACNKCPASFATDSDLRKHEPLHLVSNGFFFNCDFCKEGFWKKIHLIRHLKKSHDMQHGSQLRMKEDNKVDLTAYVQHILNKNKSFKTSVTPGLIEDDATSNIQPSVTLTTDAANGESPTLQKHTQSEKDSSDDDLFILQINYAIPKKTRNSLGHTETRGSLGTGEQDSKTHVTVNYEDDGTTSVLFHGDSSSGV